MSELKTTDDFASHVDSWYKNQLDVINHFLDVPEGVRMEVDGVENILSGDLYKGFIIAMRLVMQDLESHPPFVVLNDEVAH